MVSMLRKAKLSAEIFNEIIKTSSELIGERNMEEFESLNNYYEIIFKKLNLELDNIKEILSIASENKFNKITKDENSEILYEIVNYMNNSEAFELSEFKWLFVDENTKHIESYLRQKSIIYDKNEWSYFK